MTDTDRDLAVIADYMRRRGGAPLPAGLMASARARALSQAPERDTARTPLAAFWTRGPVAIAGALGALATVAVLLVVLTGLPLGGTDAPAADPSLDGRPSSSPAASTSSTVICGRIEAAACQAAIDLVRDSRPREVADASAIVVDDTCPPDATCDRQYSFEVAFVLVPAEGVLRDVVAFRVFGAAGPEQAATWAGALPRHVIRLIPGAPVPSVVEPSPSPEGRPAADPSLDGQPSSPAASTSSTVVCGQVEADACQTAIALVRDSHPREVADASAIVVDDTCPPYATCLAWGGFLEYPFEVVVVLVPAEGVLGDVVAFRVFGAAGPEQAATWAGTLPRHVIRLIPRAAVPSVVEPSPSPQA